MIVVSKPQEVELSLSPQELGKLRVTIAQTDQGMLVSLMAEREPTLALMRRNIEDLSSALIELGHEAPQFTFSQFSDGSENKHSAEFNGEVERGEPLLNQENLHDTEHTTGRMVLTQYGLDLRL
jgi:flagellar hook-length control protein FliK